MRLLQQLQRVATPPEHGVWLLTAGAQAGPGLPACDGAFDQAAVDQAAVVGLGRVARVEAADLQVRLVDLDPAAGVEDRATALLAEIAAADPDGDQDVAGGEDQIAWRDAKRYRVRLTAAPESVRDPSIDGGRLSVPSRGAYQLRISKPGTLEALRYEPIASLTPAAGEVVFEVHAAALNFSDVLKALGLYPGVRDAVVPLGIEASGVVTAVGEGVERFNVGDAVMGVAPYAFASHAKTPEYTLAIKPDALTHEQAAAAPIAFMTAYHGLIRLAQLAAGERVLIHAGAGGVGLAAIQIAQHAGAEVIATAGSDEKRDYLRSLGVEHVFSSRSVDFADEVLAVTDREGVDVVLNSLPGEAITKSFAVLRAYGRFLEIGKTDIYQDRKIGLLPFQDNLSYHAIDLDRVLRQRPEYVRELLSAV
ncbi:MAG: zinc-binding dehydrogenase, partial [Planctomycetota bacterium]